MNSQKLTLTLQSFDPGERKRFLEFLQSPYFNKRKDLVRLYEHLLSGQAAFGEAEKRTADQRLLLSYLQKLADRFLALEHWQQSHGAEDLALVQAYRHKALERHFRDARQLAGRRLEANPLRNADHYRHAGVLIWEEARYHSHLRREDEQYLTRLSEKADLVWVLQKLRYLCLHAAYRTRFNTGGNLSLRTEVETVLERYPFAENPVVATWYSGLKMLEMPEAAEYFPQFKKGVLEHGHCFHQEELRDLHLFAINHCIRRVNAGQTDFFHDILDIYKNGLEKGYLLENGVLSHFTYFNIAAAGLQTREYEWVEQFITQYRPNLERRYRDSTYSFNLARLKFARKEYNEVLTLLQHTNYHEPLMNMAAKTMAIKIYYSLDEYEVLTAHLDAFVKYIRRKPGLGYHRELYLQLARYTQKLVALNWNDKRAVEALRRKIEAEPVLTEREWLLEQF